MLRFLGLLSAVILWASAASGEESLDCEFRFSDEQT